MFGSLRHRERCYQARFSTRFELAPTTERTQDFKAGSLATGSQPLRQGTNPKESNRRNQARDDRENRIVHQPTLTGRKPSKRRQGEPYRTSAHLDREKSSKRRQGEPYRTSDYLDREKTKQETIGRTASCINPSWLKTGRNQAREDREPYRTSAHLDRGKPSKRR
ncbi:hypothetical protein PoB_003908400 [Plakobranchus ocellatus]|uniref:Uncharacterized protein n=1 Tax=Plakobranchus ocellatus TaxID=259542 RepID=A0AAV4B1L1_9GAST|nr:hypothetical protein PoB_003908400 [Plakobranchus ocellatus]